MAGSYSNFSSVGKCSDQIFKQKHFFGINSRIQMFWPTFLSIFFFEIKVSKILYSDPIFKQKHFIGIYSLILMFRPSFQTIFVYNKFTDSNILTKFSSKHFYKMNLLIQMFRPNLQAKTFPMLEMFWPRNVFA